MRVFLRTVFLAGLIVVGVALNSCAQRDNAPTDPGQGSWTISGKTYLAGSTEPTSGVVVKCAGSVQCLASLRPPSGTGLVGAYTLDSLVYLLPYDFWGNR